MKPTFGSLFAGIGGFDLGLERAGWTSTWQVEIDPFCRTVLAKHWPDVPRFEDVTQVTSKELAPVDLICGGFPCQDISVAGKGAGLAGARSGLWREFARLIREIRPTWVLAENVPALRSRGLGTVLQDIDALGYDAEWHCIPASAVGAPHQRDRIWIIAYARSAGLEGHRVPGAVGDDGRVRQLAHTRSDGWREERPVGRGRGEGSQAEGSDRCGSALGSALDDTLRGRHGSSEEEVCPGWLTSESTSWWASEPDVGRVAHGVPARVDRLRSLGNAVVPQVVERIGRAILGAA